MGWGPGRGPRSKVQGSQHCGEGGCWPSQEVGGKAGAPAGEVGGPLEVSLVGALHPSFPLVPRPWESRSIQDTDKLCRVTRERPRPLTGVGGGSLPVCGARSFVSFTPRSLLSPGTHRPLSRPVVGYLEKYQSKARITETCAFIPYTPSFILMQINIHLLASVRGFKITGPRLFFWAEAHGLALPRPL